MDTLVPLIAAVLAERVEDRLVLVLDDYHVIQQPGSHAFVAALVDALPPTGRMIVCSRGRPPLRVARRLPGPAHPAPPRRRGNPRE